MTEREIKTEITKYFGSYDSRYEDDIHRIENIGETRLQEDTLSSKLYKLYNLSKKDISISSLLVIVLNEESVGNYEYKLASRIVAKCNRKGL